MPFLLRELLRLISHSRLSKIITAIKPITASLLQLKLLTMSHGESSMERA
jgi:hypothetical protein